MSKPLLFALSFWAMAAPFVGRAEAQTAAEVNGQWRGDNSGNVVNQTLCAGGLEVVAVTRNVQSAALVFPQTGPNEWQSNIQGARGVVRLQNGVITVSQPGFNETFRRISGPPANPFCTTGAPPVSPATTPTAPPLQRVLTAAEQERVRAAQAQLGQSQQQLSDCRNMQQEARVSTGPVDFAPLCAEFAARVAEDQLRLTQITSGPLTPPSDANRRSRLDLALAEARWCVSRNTPLQTLRSVGGSAAIERADFSSCQPDMNTINALAAPATTPVSAPAATTQVSAPAITDSWRASLAQSSDAFTQRQHELSGRSRRVHNGANDATDCMRVEVTGTRVEWGTEGKMRMVNTCSYPVAVTWCANTTDCDRIYGGNLWTIGAGRDWPIFFSEPENPDVRLGACRTGAQAVAIAGPAGVYTDANINQRHLEPQAGSAAGARSWERNICE